jgi:hypothetical protein
VIARNTGNPDFILGKPDLARIAGTVEAAAVDQYCPEVLIGSATVPSSHTGCLDPALQPAQKLHNLVGRDPYLLPRKPDRL